MRTEMKASNECLYPTDVFLISCGMGCKRITVSDIAYIEAMKDNCIIHMVDGKRYTQSCPMGDIEPELNPNMFKRIHKRKTPMTKEDWEHMKPKFNCPFGVTNVWTTAQLRNSERIKRD